MRILDIPVFRKREAKPFASSRPENEKPAEMAGFPVSVGRAGLSLASRRAVARFGLGTASRFFLVEKLAPAFSPGRKRNHSLPHDPKTKNPPKWQAFRFLWVVQGSNLRPLA